MKRGITFIYLFMTIEFLILIFYFSIKPVKPVPVIGGVVFIDKIEHFLAYFLLSFLMYRSIKNFKLAIFLAGTYGLLMEALQFTIPNRNFSFLDILMNYAGAFFVLSGKVFRR